MNLMKKILVPLAVLLVAMLAVPLRLMHGLELAPGDIGDARLNNYFLENVYQFFIGGSQSLWHMGFFAPLPWAIGFSDNLFGTAPVYIAFRVLGALSDTAYQLWFLTGYAVNFVAAYWVLRKLGGGVWIASMGAVIFAFALPTTAHLGHAQLHYRFGIPLAAYFFGRFLEGAGGKALLIAGGWLLWQFYAGIYMGFFLLLLMGLMLVAHMLIGLLPDRTGFFGQWQALRQSIARTAGPRLALGVLIAIALFALLVLLFYPYLMVSRLYGGLRDWGAISPMLPRPQSYFQSDISHFRQWLGLHLESNAEYRHEHNMFMGFVPLILGGSGLIIACRRGLSVAMAALLGGSLLLILLTLSVDDRSFWYTLHKMPLASAIRAMTRFDQVLLFPLAVLAMYALGALLDKYGKPIGIALTLLIGVCGVSEMSAVQSNLASINEWRGRIEAARSRLPEAGAALPKDAILFFSTTPNHFTPDEIDAMWISLEQGRPTMNGYSGNAPPNYRWNFGRDCNELQSRVLTASRINGTISEENYRALIRRIVPIGFTNCPADLATHIPSFTLATQPLLPEIAASITLKIEKIDISEGSMLVRIHNNGNVVFPVGTVNDRPNRLSWRFLDAEGKPLSEWELRRDLPYDVPQNGSIVVSIYMKPPDRAVGVAVSLVAEHTFWFHDYGLVPPVATFQN